MNTTTNPIPYFTRHPDFIRGACRILYSTDTHPDIKFVRDVIDDEYNTRLAFKNLGATKDGVTVYPLTEYIETSVYEYKKEEAEKAKTIIIAWLRIFQSDIYDYDLASVRLAVFNDTHIDFVKEDLVPGIHPAMLGLPGGSTGEKAPRTFLRFRYSGGKVLDEKDRRPM